MLQDAEVSPENHNSGETKIIKAEKNKGMWRNQIRRQLGSVRLQKPIPKCAEADDKSRGMRGMAAIKQTGVKGWSENENAGHDVAVAELGPRDRRAVVDV